MAKLTIAKHFSGKIISIRDASNGLACNCKCFCCGDRLIARQGEIKDWSFAHESGAECAGAVETAIHKSAIQLICDEKKLYLGEYDPLLSLTRSLKYKLSLIYNEYKKSKPKSNLSEIEFFSNKELPTKLSNSMQQCIKSRISFSEAYSEKQAEGSSRRPDVTAVYKGRKIFIEIVVTHECDAEKISDLQLLGVPTIQINLSAILGSELNLATIRDAITRPAHTAIASRITREWLVKPKYIQEADDLAKQFFDMAMNKVQALENEEKKQLAEKRARRKIITIGGIELHIDQRETWGNIWIGRYSKHNAAIELVLKELKAKHTDYGWKVQEGKILEKIQSIQERIAIEEKTELDKQVAYRRDSEENARKKHEEYMRQHLEENRLRKIEDEIREAKLVEEEKTHAEQERLRKIKEDEIIAEVKKKHEGTVNYQFRLKKIIEELKAQGIKYR